MTPRVRLQHLAALPITNGLGLSGQHDNRDWPRYIRTTDIGGPTSIRGDVFASQPPDIASSAMLEFGDVVACAAGTIGKSLLYLEREPACYAGFLVRFRANDSTDPRFVSYWMQSADYWAQVEQGAVKSTIENFSASRFRALLIPRPELAEQRRIADFLDDRVFRIDRIIAARGEQVALLVDLRAEQLRLHVAGVFEDFSPTRSTNIGWLSRMHQEAEAVRLSRVVTLQRGVDLTEDQRQPGASKVVTTAGVVGTHDESVSPGPGVVIGRYGSVGNVHWVEGPHWPHNTTLYVRSTHGNNLRWIYYLLLTFPYEALQARAAVPGVNRNDMATEMVPLLPLHLQTVAVDHLDAAADDFGNRTRSLNRSIDFLTEYKTSLITAAVSGELDVTTAGSKLPG